MLFLWSWSKYLKMEKRERTIWGKILATNNVIANNIILRFIF